MVKTHWSRMGKILIAASSILLAAPAIADEAALFRTRAGENGDGALHAVTLRPTAGWKRVEEIDRDPLSLAQWTSSRTQCSTGASSRISLYAVDVGRNGPNKLMQKWFPEAVKFNVRAPERGFVIVQAEAESRKQQNVIAYPLSDSRITPLAGWIGGVQMVVVAESTTLSINELEDVLRQMLRNPVPIRTKNPAKVDLPFVLANSKWHKALAKRIDEGSKNGLPNALLSQAHAFFADGSGFVPAGQLLLLKAAEGQNRLAQLDLIRLSRRGLLAASISDKPFAEWTKELADLGSEDARYWVAAERKFDEDEAKMSLKPLQDLATCGHPEARRAWAKHLVYAFTKREQAQGRNLVLSIMQSPALEGTLPLTTRVPRAVEAPEFASLKATALLKSACSEDGDPEEVLFAQKADFKVHHSLVQQAAMVPMAANTDAFPELREARRIDQLVSTGEKSKINAALLSACRWNGTEADRDRLVTEVVARRDGIGRWQRFRTCEIITDGRLAGACREQRLSQIRINLDQRLAKTKQQIPAQAVKAFDALRENATSYFDSMLIRSFEQATTAEKVELDQVREQMENEFYDVIVATLGDRLDDQIKDVVTGRKLLLLPPEEDADMFSLKRPKGSTLLLQSELAKLQERMTETMKSIETADRLDMDKAFKKSLLTARAHWLNYQSSFDEFVSKLGSIGVNAAQTKVAAALWFHIEGIYYFEKIRDRQINRSTPKAPEATSVVMNNGKLKVKNRDVAGETSPHAN